MSEKTEKTEKKPTRHRATRPAEQIVKIVMEIPESLRWPTLDYAVALIKSKMKVEAAPEPDGSADPRQVELPI
jgi:hypothetical protein